MGNKKNINFKTDLKKKCAKNIISAQVIKIINKRKPVWKTGPIINFKWRVFKKKIKCQIQYFIQKTARLEVLKPAIEEIRLAESDNKINAIMENILICHKEEIS